MADKTLTLITLISIPTVMFGGYSLLRLLSVDKLNDFQKTYFRVGHAHAGVLLVMTLAALAAGARFGLSEGTTWAFGLLLLVGTLAQSGGMFLHMATGAPGRWSAGNTVTTAGAVALAAGIVTLIVGIVAA
jgi:heme/copper-type cytochrome/quinol oxidase subunit 4